MLSVSMTPFLPSCSNTHEVGQSVEILIPNEVIGKWEVTQFSDSGIDKTTLMSALILQFNSSGSMSVFASDSVVDGNWSIIEDIGLDKVSMNLYSVSVPYTTLTGTWFVFSKDYPSLSLRHSAPGREQILIIRRI
jgi:hypothetical protein